MDSSNYETLHYAVFSHLLLLPFSWVQIFSPNTIYFERQTYKLNHSVLFSSRCLNRADYSSVPKNVALSVSLFVLDRDTRRIHHSTQTNVFDFRWQVVYSNGSTEEHCIFISKDYLWVLTLIVIFKFMCYCQSIRIGHCRIYKTYVTFVKINLIVHLRLIRRMYRVIKKSVCTWWLQYRKLQVMFSVPRQPPDFYWHETHTNAICYP
jgi:hypothetical protein